MTKLTQKERREQKHDTNELDCPICLDKIDKTNKIKLGCGHTFCETCMIKHTTTEIHKKLNDDNNMEIIAPIGKHKGKIPIMTFTNDEPVVKCAVCRAEHMVITTTEKPQKILIKIEFAMDEKGLTPTHYITDYSQLFHYKPIKKHDSNTWLSLLYEIITRSKTNECNTVYVCKCDCSHEGCPDFVLCNKINYDILPCAYKGNTKFMKVQELHKYVVSYD